MDAPGFFSSGPCLLCMVNVSLHERSVGVGCCVCAVLNFYKFVVFKAFTDNTYRNDIYSSEGLRTLPHLY